MPSTSFGSSGATASPPSTETNISTTRQTSVIASADNDPEKSSTEAILPSATKTERFLLTAADQESGSRDERLNRVIRSKYEAGLLKPYNYVKGYARLSKWMDSQWVSSILLLWNLWSWSTSICQCFTGVKATNPSAPFRPTTKVQGTKHFSWDSHSNLNLTAALLHRPLLSHYETW